MQQNVRLLYRRTASIARCSQSLRPLHPVASSPSRPIRWQRRGFSTTPSRRLLLGTLDFPHLGGKHLFQVDLPEGPAIQDVNAWIKQVDTCLPPRLRRSTTRSGEVKNLNRDQPRDISLLLIEARKQAGLDILKQLGVVQERWDSVAWIVQTIADWGLSPDFWSKYPHNRIGIRSKEDSTQNRVQLNSTLDELTADNSQVSLLQNHSAVALPLDEVTIQSDPRYYDSRLRKGALGQIWQSLGAMIVKASEKQHEAQKLLPHVLSLIATLHHHDVVPEAVYKFSPTQDGWSIQQPPLLHMLSAKILTALSDAAWQAHQAATVKTTEGVTGHRSWNVSFGTPGVRSGAHVTDLRPEVWLELVLWSCLYGGWVDEGAAILDVVSNSQRETQWSLVCWQKIIDEANITPVQDTRPTFGWRDALDLLEGASPDLRPKTGDTTDVAKTVSSEVVAAYIDALLDQVFVGVGDRGTPVRAVLAQIKQFKSMLGRQGLGLGFATWDAIVQRFVESGGFWLERDPSLMLEILDLVEPYGKESEAPNVPSAANESSAPLPYFYSPSALPLSLLHRVLYAHAQRGSLDGTLVALQALQNYTELNQRRSIEQFFQKLKEMPSDLEISSPTEFQFDNGLAAADYPNFFPRIQIYVLDAFLSVIKDARDVQLFDWLLHSNDVDGPLVPDGLYKEPALAPALVRFATTTNNKSVLSNVITFHSKVSARDQSMIANPILTALLETQIERRRWESIFRIFNNTTSSTQDYNTWHPRLLSTLAREVVRMLGKKKKVTQELNKALELYRKLFNWGLDQHKVKPDVMYSQLGLLASVSAEWAEFVHGMNLLPPRSMKLAVPIECFNLVLQGVVETRGVLEAKTFWDRWCYTSEHLARARGLALFRVPRVRRSGRELFEQETKRIILSEYPAGPLQFYGRFGPNMYSVRIMLSALVEEKKGMDEHKAKEVGVWLERYAKAMSLLEGRTESESVLLSQVMEQMGLEETNQLSIKVE